MNEISCLSRFYLPKILRFILFVPLLVFSLTRGFAQLDSLPREYTAKGGNPIPIEDNWSNQYRLYLATAAPPDQYQLAYVEMRLKHTFNELDAERIRKKKLDKQLELIKRTLDEKFFKVLVKESSFEQLFREGAYSRNTYVALWSVVLNHFEIPHQIVLETPDMFLLVGNLPQQQEVRFPNRRLGEHLPPTEHLHEYAYAMRELGLVSKEEFSQKSSEDIFKENYQYERRLMTRFELAGLMYYEQAEQEYLDKKYRHVLSTLDKARNLFMTPRYQTLRSAALMQVANDTMVVQAEELAPLFEVYRRNPIPEIKTEVVKRFLFLSKELLETEDSPDKQLQLYQRFVHLADQDRELLDQLEEIHYLQMAKLFAQSYQTLGVVNYMDSLYIKRPKDKAIQNILAVLLVRSLGNDRDFENGLSVLKVYRKKYPFLGNMPLFKDLELFYQAEQARFHFAKDQTNLARNALLQFETSLVRLGQTPRVNIWVTTVYTSAADYYVRRGEDAEARRMIHRGLSLYPNSAYFQHRAEIGR
ncbi:MAG: hypothetical protein HRU41_26010 [Saprospiraceae bacterium]|nr:hypothetical protein [Saprospiraceae bacterium]